MFFRQLFDSVSGTYTYIVPAQNSESQRKPRDFCVAAIPSWA
jgi:hypothetical protein